MEPPENLNGWRGTREVTWVRAAIEEEVEEIKNEWAIGVFSVEGVDATSQLNAEALGRIRGLFFALELLTRDEEEEDER